MSAQLNFVSGTTYEDFIMKCMGLKISESTASVIIKCTVVVVEFICTSLIIMVEQLKEIISVSLFV